MYQQPGVVRTLANTNDPAPTTNYDFELSFTIPKDGYLNVIASVARPEG